MLRRRLSIQITALTTSAVLIASLAVWSAVRTYRIEAIESELNAVRSSVQEFEIHLREASFLLQSLIGQDDGAIVTRLEKHDRLALESLAYLQKNVAVLKTDAIADLTADYSGYRAISLKLLYISKQKNALFSQTVSSADRIDVLLGEDTIPAETARITAFEQHVSTLTAAKADLSKELAQFERQIDTTLEKRVLADVEIAIKASNTDKHQQHLINIGSIAVLLLLLLYAVATQWLLKRRMTVGFNSLIDISSRIRKGDLTSFCDGPKLADEFSTLFAGVSAARERLHQNTVSIDHLNTMLDRSGNLRILIHETRGICELSDALRETLGYAQGQLANSSISALFGQQLEFHTLREIVRLGLLQDQEWTVFDTRGRGIPVVMSALEVGDDYLLIVATLSGTNASRPVWAKMTEGLILVDGDGIVLHVNPAASSIFDTARTAIEGKSIDQVFYAAGCNQKLAIANIALPVQAATRTELTLTHVGIKPKQLEINAIKISAQQGSGASYVVLIKDVSQLHRVQEEIFLLAFSDPLTGLANRNRLMQRLNQAIASAQRDSTVFALLFLDMDGFKDINDSVGHGQGDQVLQEAARRLAQQIGSGDVVARLGSDEFCLLLNTVADVNTALQVAQRCVDALAQPYVLESSTAITSASVGVAFYPSDGVQPYDLMKAADTAMHSAKVSGKNRYAAYTPLMTEALQQRVALRLALREGVVKREFELFYQPLVSLKTGLMCGVEALVRWNRPGRGLIRPDEFVNAIEEMGLMSELGTWVLATACSQAVAWQKEGMQAMSMAVNVSASHFESPDFLQTVDDTLRTTGLAPNLLEVEVTESITRNPISYARVCRDLQRLGVRVAIDDFGTGYSSLAVLKDMHVNTLKLDRQFVMDVASDTASANIVRSVMDLAEDLGLTVIAEGVETMEQVYALTRFKCTLAQGYYFSQPVPADEVSGLMGLDFLEQSSRRQALTEIL